MSAKANISDRYVLISGNYKKTNFIPFPISKSKLQKGISFINLQTYQRESVETLHFDRIVKDVRKIAKILEKDLLLFCEEENIKLHDWKSKQDLILRIPVSFKLTLEDPNRKINLVLPSD